MSEMIERVGLAIQDEWQKSGMLVGSHLETEAVARAAIAAMREPTQQMLLACRAERPPARTIEDWQAMIDAALEEK